METPWGGAGRTPPPHLLLGLMGLIQGQQLPMCPYSSVFWGTELGGRVKRGHTEDFLHKHMSPTEADSGGFAEGSSVCPLTHHPPRLPALYLRLSLGPAAQCHSAACSVSVSVFIMQQQALL